MYARTQQKPTTITEQNGMLIFETPWHEGLLAAFKTVVPSTDRAWDGTKKVWTVAPKHGSTLVLLAQTYLGENPTLPQVQTVTTKQTRTLDVRYIGACKERGDGSVIAYGYCNGAWTVIFPQAVLENWFLGIVTERTPEQAQTLYAVLGIKQDEAQANIKSAYRRMVKQWHPDHCRESNASEIFQRVQAAYEVLNDPVKRARYNAGLVLEASLSKDGRPARNYFAFDYRCPLRCGTITAHGEQRLNRFIVERIEKWDDIVNGLGQTLVTSWKMGDDKFTESWV